jgi:sugar lactone lactonase YvrE
VSDKHVRKELEEIDDAQFIALDEKFFDVIGPKPHLERMFNLSTSLREAPVYIPTLNKLFISDMGLQKIMLIDLNEDEPTLEYTTLKPHLRSINGAAYSAYDDLIYATVNGGVGDVSPGIYSINPKTLETTVVINNFIGHRFNSPNDLVVDRDVIYFTDPPYAALLGNGTAPELRPIVFHYNTTSHVLRALEEDLQLPNGIALSPDNKVLYVADSGALCQPIGQPTIGTRHRSVYAYDIGRGLSNKRLVYVADFWVPDGIKVSKSGIIYSAAGIFVDIVTPEGELLGKIRMQGLLQNLVFAGPKLDELWIVGLGGLYRTRLADHGIPFSKSQFRIQQNIQ